MEKTLLGYRRFKSKAGRDCCMMNISTPCTERDNQRGAYGVNVENVFVPDDYYNYLEPGDVGKPITLNYDIVNGRAYLIYMEVKRK